MEQNLVSHNYENCSVLSIPIWIHSIQVIITKCTWQCEQSCLKLAKVQIQSGQPQRSFMLCRPQSLLYLKGVLLLGIFIQICQVFKLLLQTHTPDSKQNYILPSGKNPVDYYCAWSIDKVQFFALLVQSNLDYPDLSLDKKVWIIEVSDNQICEY